MKYLTQSVIFWRMAKMNNFLKKPAGIAGLTVLLVIFDQFTKYLAVLFLKDQDRCV